MVQCDQGYLCDVCGEEVEHVADSDLYLSFIIGDVDPQMLLSRPERHIRCNPVVAQFIVDSDFEPVIVDGPFGKQRLDPDYVTRQESLVTRGWKRLQTISKEPVPISEYPLPEVQERFRREGL